MVIAVELEDDATFVRHALVDSLLFQKWQRRIEIYGR